MPAWRGPSRFRLATGLRDVSCSAMGAPLIFGLGGGCRSFPVPRSNSSLLTPPVVGVLVGGLLELSGFDMVCLPVARTRANEPLGGRFRRSARGGGAAAAPPA